MKARKVTVEQMEEALKKVNQKYKENIIWNRFDINGSVINFTLKVKDYKSPGHRLHRLYSFDGNFKEHRSSHACWHVHGDFFDGLFSINPKAIIWSNGKRIDIHSGNWEDKNIGSMMFPQYFSESCECN